MGKVIESTHPLYGAVEAFASKISRPKEDAEYLIRALEATGYRVIGPEPTEAMLNGLALALPYPDVSEVRFLPAEIVAEARRARVVSAFRMMHATAPTITEAEAISEDADG